MRLMIPSFKTTDTMKQWISSPTDLSLNTGSAILQEKSLFTYEIADSIYLKELWSEANHASHLHLVDDQ